MVVLTIIIKLFGTKQALVLTLKPALSRHGCLVMIDNMALIVRLVGLNSIYDSLLFVWLFVVENIQGLKIRIDRLIVNIISTNVGDGTVEKVLAHGTPAYIYWAPHRLHRAFISKLRGSCLSQSVVLLEWVMQIIAILVSALML